MAYPSSVITFSEATSTGSVITGQYFTDPYNEIVAIEKGLLNGFQHTIQPLTDVTYDAGTTTLRFRSLYTSALQALDVASRVNYLTVTAAATGGTVALATAGTDATVPLSIGTKGTGTLSLLAGTTTIAALVPVASAVNYLEIDSAATTNAPNINARGTDANIGITLNTKGGTALFTDGGIRNILALVPAASAVNYLEIDSAATGNAPGLFARGSDNVINFIVNPKGAAAFIVQDAGGRNQFAATVLGSVVDYIQTVPSATGNPATVSVQAVGSDLNINTNIISKGTGVVQANGVTIATAPTFVLKKGSGAGNYSTTSAPYVDVDATNLAYTVTIPIGQKVFIAISGACQQSGTASQSISIALSDSTTTLAETQFGQGNAGNPGPIPFSLSYVFVGDGASHAFKLRFGTSGAATGLIINSSATLTPMMAFYLGPAS